MTIAIRDAELKTPDDAAAVVALIDEYARGPNGRSLPLTDEARARIAPGLCEHPASFVLLACEDGVSVGVAVCFWGFSTFAGKPLINIHDLAVTAAHRRKGVGSALIEEVLRRAAAAGCAKVTLEVHDANIRAQRLYKRMGFGPWSPAMLFVSRWL